MQIKGEWFYQLNLLNNGMSIVEAIIALGITSVIVLSVLADMRMLKNAEINAESMSEVNSLINYLAANIATESTCKNVFLINGSGSLSFLPNQTYQNVTLYNQDGTNMLAASNFTTISVKSAQLKTTGSGTAAVYNSNTLFYPALLTVTVSKAGVAKNTAFSTQVLNSYDFNLTTIVSNNQLTGCVGTRTGSNISPYGIPSCGPWQAIYMDGISLGCKTILCPPSSLPSTFNSTTGIVCQAKPSCLKVNGTGAELAGATYWDSASNSWKCGELICPQGQSILSVNPSTGFVTQCTNGPVR